MRGGFLLMKKPLGFMVSVEHVSKIRFVSGHDFSRAEKTAKSKGF
jgi:hypothetical protein